MPETVPMHIIAHIRSDFPTKFGVPRPVSYTHLTLPTTPYV